jgi:ribosomal protein S18 acetylase RimI-like enzyme
MKILIRPIKFLDINSVMQINIRCLPENYPVEFWRENYHIGKLHSFVAEVSKIIVGYIFCNEDTVISFAIDKEYRGKGIGKQLMSHCLNTFDHPIKLHVRVSNEAVKLYKSFGFEVDETVKDYYLNPVEDCYTMKWVPPSNGVKYPEQKKLNVK